MAQPRGSADLRSARLHLVALVAGAAVLAIEIVGARLLAPYFGASHIVWSAQIITTLVALAFGYRAGGALSVGPHIEARLHGCLLLAAPLLAGAVSLREPLAAFSLDFDPAVGATFASAALFFPPLVLLAVAGPCLTALLCTDDRPGAAAGTVFAVSTAGSVAGAALVAYVLAPHVANSTTLYGTAVILALVGAAGLAGARGRLVGIVGFVVTAGIVAPGFEAPDLRPPVGTHERARYDSELGVLQVVDDDVGNRRFLLDDNLVQALADPREDRSLNVYTAVLAALTVRYAPALDDILCVGLGAGLLPMDLASEGARIDVVELNPAIPAVAARWFGFDPSRVSVVIDDGRHFLRLPGPRYDAILLDAFLGESPPSHLLSLEAFAAAAARLKPGGIVLINTWQPRDEAHDFLRGSVARTFAAVFPSTLAFAARRNLVFVGSASTLVARRAPDPERVHPLIRATLEDALAAPVEVSVASGLVLTDDFNPVAPYEAWSALQRRRDWTAAMQLW